MQTSASHCRKYVVSQKHGITAKLFHILGVYRLEKPKIYVDINDIADLHRVDKDAQGLTLGGNVSLSMAMKAFEMYSMDTGFEYLRHLLKHLDLVASVPVRNVSYFFLKNNFFPNFL